MILDENISHKKEIWFKYGKYVGIDEKQLFAYFNFFKNLLFRDFPGGTVIKNPPADAADMDSSPGPGRSHMPQSN